MVRSNSVLLHKQVAIFRGLNVVGRAKTPPFTPFPTLSDLDHLAGLGINAARVPFIWEAFEPHRGMYNDTYLKSYQGVVEVRPLSCGLQTS